MADVEAVLIEQAWRAVAGDSPSSHFEVQLTGRANLLPSSLPTGAAATACVAAALVAAGALATQRSGRSPRLGLDRETVADAVRSERFFRVDGHKTMAGFAPLSRFWAARDGWVRTHANYPWHRAALLNALGLTANADADAVAASLMHQNSNDVENNVFAFGGVAARARSADEWRNEPQGLAVYDEPLVAQRIAPGAAARKRPGGDVLPADGIRVLDLTRVIAGPVCTRMLGALGATVLRLDPVGHDDLRPGTFADTLLAKRSAALDFMRDSGVARLHELLDSADVLVCGYRPGALDQFGLTDEDLARRHPGLVTVRLAAWGHTGAWGTRRGFDSVVQAATGIADAEAGANGQPGALPCQLLDHGTGYLAAAAALDGLRKQASDGGTYVRRLSLARTAAWLLEAGRNGNVDGPPRTRDRSVRIETEGGAVRAIAPPGRLDGVDLVWPPNPSRFLADRAAWPARP